MRTTKQQRQQPHRNKRRPRPGNSNNHHQIIMTPSSFTCPLTLAVMSDPVQDRCGHNFERAALLEWLQQRQQHEPPCCPISRKPLRAERDLRTNHALAEQIEQWRWHRDVGDALRAELVLEERQQQQNAARREEARNRTKPDRHDGADVDTADSSIEFEKSTLQEDDDDDYEDVELGSVVHVTEKEKHYSFPANIQKHHHPKRGYGKLSSTYCSYSRATTTSITTDHPLDHHNDAAAAAAAANTTNTMMMLLPQERQLLQLVRAREEAERRARERQQMLFAVTVLLVFLAGLTVGAARTLRRQPLK